jgi:proteic killer suppression protein
MDSKPKYRDRDTERFANNERVRRFESIPRQVGMARLKRFDAATSLDDLRIPPGNRLEALRGNREGQYSIRINDQWRICFNWSENRNEAFNIEIVDYH